MKFKFKVVGKFFWPSSMRDDAMQLLVAFTWKKWDWKKRRVWFCGPWRSGMNYVNRETYVNHKQSRDRWDLDPKTRPWGLWVKHRSANKRPQSILRFHQLRKLPTAYDRSPTILSSDVFVFFFWDQHFLLERPRRFRLAIALSSKFKIKSRDNKVNTLAVMQTNAKLGGK